MLVGGLLTLIIGFTEGVKCQYCNNDFVSVKRHEWRCKSRCTAIATVLHSAHAVASNQPVSASLLPDQSTTDAGGPPVDDTTCVCGRKCAGRRGLRAHERSCPVLKSLMKSSTDQATQPSAAAAHPPAQADDDITTSPRPPPTFQVKPGLKLPKTNDQWTEANLFFKLHLSSYLSKPFANLDADVSKIQDEVYEYFATTWGTVTAENDSDFSSKYKDKSIASLQKSLKRLKNMASVVNNNIDEIKYVSALIRSKLSMSKKDKQGIINDSSLSLSRNLNIRFWKTCKSLFNSVNRVTPSFDITACFNYFVTVLTQVDRLRSFVMPTWIPPLPSAASTDHCDACPSYCQVASAINRCRPNASACPLDQLSIIILKRCPILRTFLHHIIAACWSQGCIPSCWKVSGTILIYKKGNTNDPENFRPITLQPVWYKIFSSVYSNKLYDFVIKNNYLDKKI